MMSRTAPIPILLLVAGIGYGQSADAQRIAIEGLRREADRFVELAPQVQAVETLTQTRRPRIQRQIVSSYGFLSLAPGEVREIRQVEIADGKPVRKHGRALEALAKSLMAAEDGERRKLLESFEKNGLHGVAVDFAPVLQMFSGANLLKFEFSFQRIGTFAGAPVAIYLFEQIDGLGGLTIYSTHSSIHQKLRGQVWVRPADGSPVRIVLDSLFDDKNGQMRHLTVVDYAASEFGLLVPLAVTHQQFQDRALLVEDRFRYAGYRRTP